jgi:hypothetical protein
MAITATKRYELVELTIPAGVAAGSRVAFNTIPQLRNQANQTITIQDIAVYPDTSYGHSQVTPTVVGFPVAEIPKGVLVLYVNGEESIKMIPLAELIHINDAANPFQQNWYPFNDLENVDWDKSYVQFNAAAAGNPYIIPFGIRYMRFMKDAQGNMKEA